MEAKKQAAQAVQSSPKPLVEIIDDIVKLIEVDFDDDIETLLVQLGMTPKQAKSLKAYADGRALIDIAKEDFDSDNAFTAYSAVNGAAKKILRAFALVKLVSINKELLRAALLRYLYTSLKEELLKK